MVLEGASTSPFVCAALGVGRGEAANSTTVRGLGGLVGVLVTGVPKASPLTFGSGTNPTTSHSIEVPGFLTRRTRARRFLGGERLFSRSKHILERLNVRWTFIESDVRGSGGEVRWLVGTY